MDANNRLLAPLVADTSLDFIESFTPPPECDLSIKDARELWPGMAVLLNFPSSLHLKGPEGVAEAARAYLREASPGDRFVFGQLENLPSLDPDTLLTLAEVVNHSGMNPY